MKIEDSDFPSLFLAADSASLRAQKKYLLCMRTDLLLISGAGLAGAISFSEYQGKLVLAIITAVLMLASLFLTLYIRGRKFEQTWFDGRAVAESIKTSAWRFMVGSDPFAQTLVEKEAIKLFTGSVKKVIDDRDKFAAYLATRTNTSDAYITEKMLEVRRLSLRERKELYLTARLENQHAWYSSKSEANSNSSTRWFNAILVLQAIAVLSAFVFLKFPDFPIVLPSVFATIVAAFVAWLQLKRHQELANSYGLAAQELLFIAQQIKTGETEVEFSGFVGDAENAISREHTMWVSRRDQI